MERILDRMDERATGRNLLLLAAVLVLFSGFLFPVVTSRIESFSGGVGILDLTLHFSPGEAYSRIDAYGPRGRRLYGWMAMTLDVVYPLAYGAFFSFFILYFLRRGSPPSPGLRRLALLPVGAVFADIFENVGITVLLVAYPRRLEGAAALAGYVTTAKWLFVGLSAVAAVFAVAAGGVRWSGST